MTILTILASATLATCPVPPEDPGFDAVAYLAGADRAGLAAMVACLEHPDPVVRDERAYAAFAAALRAGKIEKDRRADLLDMLVERLASADGDPGGFRGPFALLVLAELARTDRIEPWLDADELGRLVQVAGFALSEVTDYRGFVDGEGWRHGVAHGADLMMQLSLNPQVDRTMALAMLAAIASQVAPDDHAYRFGEPARLARPVLILADRDLLREGEFENWFAALHPPVDGDWADRYNHAATLTKMHNLRAFALEVHALAIRQEESPAKALAPLALELMRKTAG